MIGVWLGLRLFYIDFLGGAGLGDRSLVVLGHDLFGPFWFKTDPKWPEQIVAVLHGFWGGCWPWGDQISKVCGDLV